MTFTIALAGKGGVGKTTIAAMIIKHLAQTQPGAVLAIDADPSSNLHFTLGLKLEWTIGDIREDMLDQVKQSLVAGGAAMGSVGGGMSKREYLDYQIRSSVAEGRHFDLITMGRPEGAGCYCAVNHNLRDVVDSISKNYRYVVIDNEAGMEHLSRRTTRDVQVLLVVTDPSLRGLAAAEQIGRFRHDLDIRIEQTYLILNGVRQPDLAAPLREKIDALDIPLLGTVPYADELAAFELGGHPLVDLDDASPVYQAVSAMLNHILSTTKTQ